MAQIEVDDRIFSAAQRRAADGGYSSVDAYIADLLTHDLAEVEEAPTPDLDHLFTPERLNQIDEAAAEIQAGNGYTSDQVREHFKQRRAASSNFSLWAFVSDEIYARLGRD